MTVLKRRSWRQEGHSTSLLRTMWSALTIQTAGATVNLLAQTALARALGAARFGQYSYVFNMAQLLATPTDLGASSSVTRFLPEYEVQVRRGLLRGFLLVVWLVPVCLGSVVASVAATLVLVFGRESTPVPLVMVAIATIPPFALSIVMMNVLRAFGSLVSAFVPILVLQPMVILGAVILFPDAGALTYAWCALGGLASVISLQAFALRRRMRTLGDAPREFALGHWREVSLPMLLITVVQLAFQRLDIVAVGLLLGAREAGIYVIANRLAVAAASIQKAMVTVIAPKMSSLHWSGDTDEVEELLLRGLRLAFIPAAAVTVVLIVAGGQILGAVGSPYRAGYAALVVYSLGQLVGVAAGPVGWLAAITGQQRAMARIAVWSALIATAGYALLIPTLGIVGAATANSIGIVGRNYAAGRLVSRQGFEISLLRAFRRRRQLAPRP